MRTNPKGLGKAVDYTMTSERPEDVRVSGRYQGRQASTAVGGEDNYSGVRSHPGNSRGAARDKWRQQKVPITPDLGDLA